MLNRTIMIATLFILVLAACQPAQSAQLTPTAGVTPTPEPTAPPQRTLVICLGQEPQTLYPFGSSSRSTWGVLESVYDGPFDTRQFGVQPVILQPLPTLDNGDAAIRPVTVQAGDLVQTADNQIVSLVSGMRVAPSGCRDQGCTIAWDGESPLQLDQVSAAFRLLPGLTWSDGSPLTSSDSVYAFNLSRDPATPVIKNLIYRTESYEALDALTILWKGIPGYLPQAFQTHFWMPLPEHAWQELSPEQLLSAPVSVESPLGWGPYIIDEWVRGDHITLRRNPAYFRASEGLPYFDNLVYRFLGYPGDNNLAALQAGECDLVDHTSLLDDQLEPVMEMQRDGILKAYVGQGPEWELLTFGIRPVTYDDGYNPYGADRPDFLGDLRMRQAIAHCVDREGFVVKPLMSQSSVPGGFYPPDHPQFLADLAPLPYDPQTGQTLLEAIGWQNDDGNPGTPRIAVGVPGIPDGTPLALTYTTSQSSLRAEYAQKAADSLTQCGFEVSLQVVDVATLYEPGPDGVIFGRNFDLAQFAWEAGRDSPCWLFTGEQIPNQANNWLGVNAGGFDLPEFNEACAAARLARPEDPDYSEKQSAVQRIFARELPALPLYFRMKMTITRPDFCGMEMDVTARTPLWNLEAFNYGEDCQ